MCRQCGTLHGDYPGAPDDTDGCILPSGHIGPHEFVDADGQHWLWETDLECNCEHCMRCDGDYCTLYWEKPEHAETGG